MASDAQTGPALEARGIVRTFGTGAGVAQALRGVDAQVGDGEFVAIMGRARRRTVRPSDARSMR